MAYNPNNPNGQASQANSSPVVIASNQSDLAVATSPAAVVVTPTSNSMAALNASVTYQVESGAGVFLTLTNPAAATTVWSGTVSFTYSLDGSTFTALSVMPVSSPANSASVTTATANGLFYTEVPSGTASVNTSSVCYIRAQMTAYTSGTAYFFVQSSAVPNARVVLPWTYTVTSGQTLVGPIEASGISEVSIQLSAVTTTILTAQGSNDPGLTTWQTIPNISTNAQAASTATMTAANTYRFNPNGYKWFRVQCTTTGTVLTVQGVSATLGQQVFLTAFGNDTGVVVNSGTLTTLTTLTTCSTVTSVTAVAALNSVATTNGLSIGTVVTTATPATNSIKASAGRLHHISVGNPNAAAVYLKIWNVAAPTLGTTAANMNYLIPATSQTTIPINDIGLFFSTAIVFAVTGGIALTDNTTITSGCAVSYSWI